MDGLVGAVVEHQSTQPAVAYSTSANPALDRQRNGDAYDNALMETINGL